MSEGHDEGAVCRTVCSAQHERNGLLVVVEEVRSSTIIFSSSVCGLTVWGGFSVWWGRNGLRGC